MLRESSIAPSENWTGQLIRVLPQRIWMGGLLVAVAAVVDLPWLEVAPGLILSIRAAMILTALALGWVARFCRTPPQAVAVVTLFIILEPLGMALIGAIEGTYVLYTNGVTLTLMFAAIFLPLPVAVFSGHLVALALLWFGVYPALLPMEYDRRELVMHLGGYLTTAAMLVLWNRMYLRLRSAETAQRLRLEQLSQRDELTGLYNYRHFQTALRQFLTEARAQGTPLALCLLDLDHFKAVNDTAGHGVGNMVLQRVARHLMTGVRQNDLAARIGGDEFALILPGATAVTARAVLERIQESLTVAEEGLPVVTFSAGVAEWGPEWSSPEALLEAADLASYAAKRAGRRVVIAPADARRS